MGASWRQEEQMRELILYPALCYPTLSPPRQEELTKLLDVILGDPALRLRAATGIWGGKLPP
eukprot:1161453-Pyramimonas_sp.AAC.1